MAPEQRVTVAANTGKGVKLMKGESLWKNAVLEAWRHFCEEPNVSLAPGVATHHPPTTATAGKREREEDFDEGDVALKARRLG